MRIEYHRTLVADRVRNRAFREALSRAILKGETVVADIGAGTGLMALYAARLGARAVYLYEAAEVAGVAAQVLAANGAERCELIPCHSTEMQDPPQVDIVVSETLGNYALEENIVATLADAKRRHLKRGGTIIPSRISQFVAPVVSPRIHRELTVWERVGDGLDFCPARDMSLNNAYVRRLKPADLLDDGRSAAAWDTIDLGRETRSTRKGEARWTIASPKTVYGLAYWWQAELVEGVTLSTAPDAPRTHWEQLYFPLSRPVSVAKGETLVATLASTSSEEAGTHLSWDVAHLSADGLELSSQAHDLDRGWIP